jgi:hypothetical protein
MELAREGPSMHWGALREGRSGVNWAWDWGPHACKTHGHCRLIRPRSQRQDQKTVRDLGARRE